MRVSELRKTLGQFDSEYEVVINKDRDGWFDIDEVELVEPESEDESFTVSINYNI